MPRMNFRLAGMAGMAAVCALLAGCGDEPQQRPPVYTPPKSQEGDLTKALLDRLRTPAIKGALLVAKPEAVRLRLMKDGEAGTAIRVTNEGDEGATIDAIDFYTPLRGARFSDAAGACKPTTQLMPNEHCDIELRYKDDTGRSIESGLYVASNAKQSSRLQLPVIIEVEIPPPPPPPPPEPAKQPEPTPEPPPAPVAPPPVAPPEPPKPPPYVRPARPDLRQQGAAGGYDAARGSGIGRVSERAHAAAFQPQPSRRALDPRYPEDAFPWTRTTLPVDRTRILTSDRTIKAVVERGFTNVMCDKVTAVAESDVYAPDNTNVLIPAGTRFEGKCNGFTDERAGVAWTRFIAPNGVSAKLNATGADAGGLGGVPGHLDRRWWDRIGIPLAFSMLRSGIMWAFGGDESSTTNLDSGVSTSSRSAGARAMDSFQQDTQQSMQQIQQKLQDVKEVLRVPGGTRIDIVLSEDIYFRSPYEVVSLAGYEYELKREEETSRMRAVTPSGFRAFSPTAAPMPLPAGSTSVRVDGVQYILVPESALDERGVLTAPASDAGQGAPYGIQPAAQAGTGDRARPLAPQPAR